jgi:ATP-dependent Clp protease ATP-binding subunit ClpX
MIQIDTKNILFIAGGAFDGMDKIIASRLRTNVIGYSYSKDQESIDRENLLQYISPPDLKKYGLIPEIVGRMPVVTFLHPLHRETLRRILTEPKNSLVRQYTRLFEMDGIKLKFEENVLDFIVDKSIEFKLGARGLRSIVEGILTDAMFELPSTKAARELTISKDYAEEKFRKTNMAHLKVA